MNDFTEKKNLLIIPYTSATPTFLSEDFFDICLFLLSLEDYDSIIFPFYIDGYIKHYAGMYIHKGEIVCLFGENFRTNVLSFNIQDKACNILLFPYIYSNEFKQDTSVNICIDDELYPKESKKFGNYIFVPPCFNGEVEDKNNIFDKCFQKGHKICIQTLEKLLKYN